MSKTGKAIIGIGGTLLLILIALFFFLRSLVTKSFPVTNGTLAVSGIREPVDVYRDEFGVPHILARNEHDLMFAVGYVHAQDRLWQMEMSRRAGEGRLSEIFDTSTVRYDKLFRTLGLSILADSLEAHLHPESRRILEDYAAGVNEFIGTHAGKFPIEFDMLGYDPKPWTVKQSLLVGRLMAWELDFSWWVDLTYGELASTLPSEKFRQLLPSWPDSVPVLVRRDQIKAFSSDLRECLDGTRSVREFLRCGAYSAGSNAWVVKGSRSMRGKPLLANDPHLRVSVPSRWYELHCSSPAVNVAGVSIPGVPVVVIGHNDSLAWGMTNAMLDDTDFYLEHEDSSGHYRYKNVLLPVRTRTERIYVGKADSIEFTVRSTMHGPVVNGVRHSLATAAKDSPGHAIAMRWTGFEMSDETFGFYQMDRARNKAEFELGLKAVAVPGQCVVYGDVDDNIGMWTAAKVPVRGKYNPMIPQPGWTGEAEWAGYVPFEQLPKLWNPPQGVVVSANQKIADDQFPHYLSNLWEPTSRATRIRELLASAEKFTVGDFEQLQQDVLSPQSREMAGIILRAFDPDTVRDPYVKSALEYIRNWDYRCTAPDVATTIVNTFFVKLLHNTYEDEMGPALFRDFVYFSAIPYRVTSQLLASDSSAWFDNVTTPKRESRDDIVRQSLQDAVEELKATLGGETKTWQWGEIHKVLFEHPFGKRKPLDNVFNVGPFPIGGSATTVNKADFSLTSPYYFSAGTSLRQVVDLSNPKLSYIVITLGESGQPLERHYNDQTALWRNGGYDQVTSNWSEIKRSGWDLLHLQPAQ